MPGGGACGCRCGNGWARTRFWCWPVCWPGGSCGSGGSITRSTCTREAPGCSWWPRRSWSSWRVESALLFGSARLCDESDERWLRRTLADPWFYVTEAAVLALGAVTGLLGAAAPWFVLLLVHGGGRHRVAGRAVVH